jgi:carboxyl-terminal processing protease
LRKILPHFIYLNMKHTLKYITVVALALTVCSTSFAQTKNFKLGKWVEIQNAILKELNRSYVDTLPLDRMEKKGIDSMLEELDPYTVYVPEEDNEDFSMLINKTYGGIGAIIYKPEKNGNVIINEPYFNSPAYKNGLVCGDEIVTINGESVKGMETKDASDKMKGKPGTNVTFTVKKLRSGATWKAGDTITVTITRERIHLPDVEYAGMINPTTGYILQSGFTEGLSETIKTNVNMLKAKGMKMLVLDLRGNGGGLMQEAIKEVSLFVPKGSTVVSSKGNNEEAKVYKTSGDPIDTQIPIIVLVDSGTASSSEIVSGALQDLDRATIMGERTYGKGLVQSIRPLPYNGQLKVTTAKYYTPSGRCVQAIDYSLRKDDGSVAHIPDSLTHAFKTLHGRTVRDGGGITPDDSLKSHNYSRLTYSLVVNGIIEQYAMKYVREHESIAPVEKYHLSDAEYNDFIAFAKTKTFDFRSSAKALYDQMKKELEKDGLAANMKDQLTAMNKAIDIDKESFLKMKKSEIVPLIEEEIVTRYYYQEAGVQIRIRYDEELKEALTKPLIKY